MNPFTLLIKPSGSDCNIDCKYCFYKNRSAQVGIGKQRMGVKVLEKLVKDYLALGFGINGFAWQGGEPTLMGLDFFKEVVKLQNRYRAPGQAIENSLQTNSILLDDDWCRFLRENNFLVGISVDGPEYLHDYYRVNFNSDGTFDKVMAAIERCKKHEVQFNTLTLLNDNNVEHVKELFDFFVENDVKYQQFIPCVEIDPGTGEIADFSITPKQYGDFLCSLFDLWYEFGPEKISIRDFDSIISFCLSGKHTICTFSKQCSGYIVVEHTGQCFCCDFFVRDEFALGNIFETDIAKLAGSDVKRKFARDKQKLPGKCLVCRHLDVCRGGCMKDRIIVEGCQKRENYFCESYKAFFGHSMPRFMQIAAKVASGQQNLNR